MSGSTSSNLEVVAGFGGDCEAVALLSVAGKKTPTLPGQWSVPELQAEEKIAVYNRQKSAGAHLKMLDGQIYSGLLRFTYCPDGTNTAKSHDLHVTSEMTCSDVIPMLHRHLVPHLNGTADPTEHGLGHISLMQGEMDRVLEDSDKPLEIALDCSTKGLASPKFIFRPPSERSSRSGTASRRMRTSQFTSYLGALTTNSNPNLAYTSSSLPTNHSPHLHTSLDHGHHHSQRWLSTDGEQNSLYSANSYNSISSGGRSARKLQHMSKSVTALGSLQRKKLVHTLSDNSEQTTPNSPMLTLQPPILTDSSTPPSLTKGSRARTSVGNFITRSLRVHKKSKSKRKTAKSLVDCSAESGSQGSLILTPTTPEDKEASAKVSKFASPMLAERKLTMSTVMHIHFRDATEALTYKSLLVSQIATAREVVLQALDRFNMTTVDVRDFSLYVVVGRWQDVSQSVVNGEIVGPDAAISLSNVSVLSVPRPAITSIEEFVVCYSREVGSKECPYNLQFYFSVPEGYTRRFELRQREKRRLNARMKSRSHEALDTKEGNMSSLVTESTPKRLSWANTEVLRNNESSPLFGHTNQRTPGRQRNYPSGSLSSAVLEGSETEEDILDKKEEEEAEEGDRVSVSGDGAAAKREEEKVKLRERKTKTTESGGRLEGNEDGAPDVSTMDASHARQLLSMTSSSPDSGVVSFSKDKKPRHDSAVFSSTSDQLQQHSDHLESVSTHNTPTRSPASLYPAHFKTAFLLSLKLHDPEKELLIQPLRAPVVHITAGGDSSEPDGSEESSTQRVFLYHPNLSHHSQPLCSIRQQSSSTQEEEATANTRAPARKEYVLHPTTMTQPGVPIHLNGSMIADPTPLAHGDLLSVCNECYLFLFQDYSSLSAMQPTQHYSWRPHPLNYLMPAASPGIPCTPPPSSPITKNVVSEREDDGLGAVVVAGGGSQETAVSLHTAVEKLQPERLFASTAQASPLHISLSYTYPSPASQDTTVFSQTSVDEPAELPATRHDVACQTPTPSQERRHATPDGAHLRLDYEERGGGGGRPGSADSQRHMQGSTPTRTGGYNSLKRSRKTHRHRHRHHHRLSSSSSSLSSTKSTNSLSLSRKSSLFSFNLSEEGDLLRHLVNDLDIGVVPCRLGPALLLAMCTEYCHKCHGPAATSRFLQKTVDCIQEVVWDCTKKLITWKPDPAMVSRPLSHCEGLFPLLQPAVFWLANALELHHLLTHCCSPLANQPIEQGENPVNTLHDILVYTFQQMFYTVSKVLFHSLPLVLDGCERGDKGREGREGGGEEEIVEQAVDFLQALLDLMTDLHLHLEVVSCFYANLFFFINTTLLNSVMDLGPQRGLFTHSAGTTLRSSLSLLEGWACQVGFKEAVLHHLARLSSILDILATPPHTLVQLSWDELRDEYPVLHPSQLHLLLSHYTPPPSLSTPPHWAPTPTDTSQAHNTALVSESYDCHPGFSLPTDSYTLQLKRPHPQPAEFQALMDDLHSALKHNTKSVDVVPVVESAPSAQVPTLLTNITTPSSPPHHHGEGEGEAEDEVDGSQRQDDCREQQEDGDKRIMIKISGTESPFLHALSRECLREIANTENPGIGSNTESQDDLLDTQARNLRNRHEENKRLGLKRPGSGSKVASLISNYEESAKLSQGSSSESGGLEGRWGKDRVGRVISMVTPQSYSKPETLVLQEVEGCDGDAVEDWVTATFPVGAHTVNIQRGDKGFGVVLVEQKDPVTGNAAIYIQRLLPGSTGDQCKELMTGDRVLAIDCRILDGADYLIAEKYLKEAEDDVQLVLAPRPQPVHSQ